MKSIIIAMLLAVNLPAFANEEPEVTPNDIISIIHEAQEQLAEIKEAL